MSRMSRMHPWKQFSTWALLLAAALFDPVSNATPIRQLQEQRQSPLHQQADTTAPKAQQLHGRFLHITDFHPDQFYRIHASTEEDLACHRGNGPAGTYGAETSDCDSPFSLINATFKWIEDNLSDKIDFVVWTGDSARHDSDEKIPRTQSQVLDTNRFLVSKVVEAFGNGRDEEDATKDLKIPVIPTFGNNDILPHNILQSGPNKWLREYTDVWRKFIPEEQRHGFERGGWFWVEVIPEKLAVFSLNTLYFFNNNAAVDGCASKSEPGYEHMEWLRIQLGFMRQRGMKAILTGHVPPARTDSKQLWDETCWQKYTLWLDRYRDVVVGGLYGHMNIDHFMLQDTKDVDLLAVQGIKPFSEFKRAPLELDDDLTVASASDYLEELRENWSNIPNPNLAFEGLDFADDGEDSLMNMAGKKKKKGKKSKKDKALKKIGGPWGERFQVTNIGPSVVPNYFPTLRVIDYNISGLELSKVWSRQSSQAIQEMDWLEEDDGFELTKSALGDELLSESTERDKKKKGKKGRKGKKPKKPENPDLTIPDPPSKSSPPGPAYSPQTLTMLGYTQYFANLTHINNDYVESDNKDLSEAIDTDSWHGGKHKDKDPKDNIPKPKPFEFEVEYDTYTDPIYKLKDMTVRSYIKLAHRIGRYKPAKGDQLDDGDNLNEPDTEELSENDDVEDLGGKDKDKKKKKKHHKQKKKNKVWLYFVKRAFVGTMDDENLRKKWDVNRLLEYPLQGAAHDGEL
ncbi:hypothetical protein BP5796_04142 [Coleophoma crateriformis]|uniref:Endopolyphosphatase n=1 Tax=Coleophoma crateriformis TaxID=565419 RepID=A0A3D8SHJ1_9HELO|nr:hypothetical protein BP5796_04142 [Coleophoma crateriformis]